MNSKLEYIKENLNIINQMIEAKRPKFEIARVLNVKYETLNKYFKILGIEYKGNPNRKGIPHLESRTLVEEYFTGKRNITASNLRNKLIEEGIKERRCEKCGRTEWEGKPIPLELHHKNMNHNDNRLENLQILCSNCHSIAHNYCNTSGKEKSKVNTVLLDKILNTKSKNKEDKFCVVCGKKLKSGQKKYCSQKCFHQSLSKTPNIDELLTKLNEFNWNKTKTGKYFGVSDSAIKKWIKKFNLSK